MEIKKLEVITSVIIVSVMLISGFFISEKIRQNMLEEYQKYDTAVQIESEQLFRYGMRTGIGNAFVYGDLKTLDPVVFPEIQGEYSYIKKEEQEYRKHIRLVTVEIKDEDGNVIGTETEEEEYWTWDTMRTESKKATKISFLNVEFEYGKVPFPSSSYIKTLDTGYHKRNVYYGTKTNFTGTIFTSLKDDTINETSFFNNRTIAEAIEHLESGYQIVIFWVVWILLTIVLVVIFYFLENRWLD